MLEEEILNFAITALRDETRMEINILEREFGRGENNKADALIEMPGCKTQLVVEIKKWAQQMNVGAVIHHMKTQHGDKGLFVGDYINANTGEKLRDANVQYVDTAGNAYINQKPLYIHITGRKKNIEYKLEERAGRAFNATGLKVIYLFLVDPDLVNATYREIAARAKVALGNIGWIMRDLVNGGYIQEALNTKTKKVTEYDRLLERWAEQYPLALKPKLKLMEFITENPAWWKEINAAAIGAYWGGELAAAEYTDYLNPLEGTVYIAKERVTELAVKARLRKRKEGEREGYKVEVFEKFWVDDFGAEQEGLANPIIVYADLIETGDTRNLETAERLREKFINRRHC